jgi:hypothetical protein
MANVRNYTDADILKRVESLSTFKGWKLGIYEINIRSTEDEFDAFDDKAYLYEVGEDGKPKFVMVRNVTTNTGSYGLKKFHEYNHLGAAVLKSDWMIYGSHTYGLHKGKKPAYRQAKPWPYYRDNNRNNRAEEIGKVYNDIIGANIHRAGTDSTVIKNWSTACLVTATESKFLAFLAFMKSKGNPPLNVAILKEFDPKTTISAVASNGDSATLDNQTNSVLPPADNPSEQQPTDSTTHTEEVEAATNGETSSAKTTTTSETVTLKSVGTSLAAKVIAFFTMLTGIGINAGTIVETKLSEMTLNHVAIIALGVAVMVLAVFYYRHRQEAADHKDKMLIEKAADPQQNTVEMHRRGWIEWS